MLSGSKRKSTLIATDDGKEFFNEMFTYLFNINNLERYSRNTSKRAVFAESFEKTIKKLEKPFSEKIGTNSIKILPTLRERDTTIQYILQFN